MILKICFNLYKNIISPLLHSKSNYGCKFYPTCSEYLYLAVKKYGIFRGVFKGLKRLSKCHPFNLGGYDPA